MIRRDRQYLWRLSGSTHILRLLVLPFLVTLNVPIQAQTQPGATPGGALPKINKPIQASEPQKPLFPIPTAVERPLEEDAGDRLFVRKFNLTGITAKAKNGIDRKQLATLVEELRAQRQGLDKVDEDGFTAEDRHEIAAFMREVISNPDLEYMGPEYEALIDRLREMKSERDAGMTVGQMQQIANAITEYYRSAGFILAQAYIPAQEVDDGVVNIAILEGNLGNVLVEGNKDYSADVLAKPFADLIDAPVTASEVESAILTAGDYPGLSVFGVFRPGKNVGETDLVVRVQDERPWDLSVRADNHGTRFTGKNRAVVEGSYNNLTGVGDVISGTALRQYNPANAFFGKVEYRRPFWLPGLNVGTSFERNPFNVGAEVKAAGISGSTTAADVYAEKSLVRSRELSIYGKLGLRRERSVTEVNKRKTNKDNLAFLYGNARFESINADARAIDAGSLGFAYGLGGKLGGSNSADAAGQAIPPSRQGGSKNFASNDFWKLEGSFSRLQKITGDISFLARFEGQFSNVRLPPPEQYSIGGPTNVRAYNASEFLADTAFYSSVEVSMKAPGFADAKFSDSTTWGNVLRVSFFADYAWGRINDPSATDDANLNVGGVGAGLNINLPGQTLGRVQWALPVGTHVPGDPGDRDSGKWWADVTYQF